ncbi:MAG TPA: hypothetical protein VHD38_02470 [Candidatus Paceibacterota bacterium]|jgi:hypothetical protein|nr:hypothetical protein [Candidatus Paceibacterota bacterium]
MTLKTIGKTLGTAAIGSMLLTGAAFAQTDTTDVTGSTTVGTPNTGSGGDLAVNMLVLGGSAAAAFAAFAYMRKQRA